MYVLQARHSKALEIQFEHGWRRRRCGTFNCIRSYSFEQKAALVGSGQATYVFCRGGACCGEGLIYDNPHMQLRNSTNIITA